MPKYTKQQLEAQYEKLPDTLKDAIFSAEIAEKMFAIGKKHGLTMEKTGFAAEETGFVILGLLPPREFASSLASRLDIDMDKAVAIASDINHQIFFPLREALKETHQIEIGEASIHHEEILPRRPDTPTVPASKTPETPRPPAPTPAAPAASVPIPPAPAPPQNIIPQKPIEKTKLFTPPTGGPILPPVPTAPRIISPIPPAAPQPVTPKPAPITLAPLTPTASIKNFIPTSVQSGRAEELKVTEKKISEPITSPTFPNKINLSGMAVSRHPDIPSQNHSTVEGGGMKLESLKTTLAPPKPETAKPPEATEPQQPPPPPQKQPEAPKTGGQKKPPPIVLRPKFTDDLQKEIAPLIGGMSTPTPPEVWGSTLAPRGFLTREATEKLVAEKLAEQTNIKQQEAMSPDWADRQAGIEEQALKNTDMTPKMSPMPIRVSMSLNPPETAGTTPPPIKLEPLGGTAAAPRIDLPLGTAKVPALDLRNVPKPQVGKRYDGFDPYKEPVE